VNSFEMAAPTVPEKVLAEVVAAFHRDHLRPRRRRLRIAGEPQELVLARELNRAVVGAMHQHLRARQQAIAELKSDARGAVESKQVGEEVPDVAFGDGPGERWVRRKLSLPLAGAAWWAARSA
jgi:hypothetical protein